jgi:aryl-alcohol dehydrogenase-like predicted oxidoreductase
MSSAVAMATRPLGAGGPPVSVLGLGTWAIGGPWVRGWGPQDDGESIATIHHAVARGVTWIDTAPVYGLGHSEEIVGRAVAALSPGERPRVFTKCGRVERDGTVQSIGDPASLRAECETSLRRLGVEALDLLQLHWPPQDGTTLEEAWSCLAQLRAEGRAARVGVSNVTAEQLATLEAIAHVDTVQPPLSLINRGALEDLLALCRANGTGAIVYAPMEAGLLSGAFDRRRLATLDPGDWRRSAPQFTEPRLSRNLALADALGPVAAALGLGLAELAIAWVLDQPGVTGAIVGARRPDQVDGWIGAGAVRLTDEARGQITDALAATGA